MRLYVVGALMLVALINTATSVGVVRDAGLNPVQRVFQIVVVWFLPLLGAALTYFFRRYTSVQPTHHNVFESPSIGEGANFPVAGHSSDHHAP
jgi:phosphate/sulfate permease